MEYFAKVAASICCVEAEHRVLGREIGGKRPANQKAYEQTDGFTSLAHGPNSAVDALAPFLNPSNGPAYSLQQALANQGNVIYGVAIQDGVAGGNSLLAQRQTRGCIAGRMMRPLGGHCHARRFFQPMHLLVILFIALLVFGPKKLPEFGKGWATGFAPSKTACATMPPLPRKLRSIRLRSNAERPCS